MVRYDPPNSSAPIAEPCANDSMALAIWRMLEARYGRRIRGKESGGKWALMWLVQIVGTPTATHRMEYEAPISTSSVGGEAKDDVKLVRRRQPSTVLNEGYTDH